MNRIAALLVTLACATLVHAQTWPTHAIKLIVHHAPRADRSIDEDHIIGSYGCHG